MELHFHSDLASSQYKNPDYGQYICPKNVESFSKINLRNSACCWVLLQEYITIHSRLNVKIIHLISNMELILEN